MILACGLKLQRGLTGIPSGQHNAIDALSKDFDRHADLARAPPGADVHVVVTVIDSVYGDDSSIAEPFSTIFDAQQYVRLRDIELAPIVNMYLQFQPTSLVKQDGAGPNVKVLAQIARLTSDSEFCNALREAKSPRDVLNIIQEAE